MVALKCWLQEMLATEIGLASSRRRGGVAAAMPGRRHGDVAVHTWRHAPQLRRGDAAATPL